MRRDRDLAAFLLGGIGGVVAGGWFIWHLLTPPPYHGPDDDDDEFPRTPSPSSGPERALVVVPAEDVPDTIPAWMVDEVQVPI